MGKENVTVAKIGIQACDQAEGHQEEAEHDSDMTYDFDQGE
jgi:hypothetical protein